MKTAQKVATLGIIAGLVYGGVKLLSGPKKAAPTPPAGLGFVMALYDAAGNPIGTTIRAGQPITAKVTAINTSRLGGLYVPVTVTMHLAASYGTTLIPTVDQVVTLPANGSLDVSWTLTFPVAAASGILECQALAGEYTEHLYTGEDVITYRGATMDVGSAIAPIASYVQSVRYWDDALQAWLAPKNLVTGQAYSILVSAACDWTYPAVQAEAMLAVTISGALTINTASLPSGYVGFAYSQTLQASGGTGSYTWSRVWGMMPAGLSLSSSGVISGTPTTAATFSFVVKVTDGVNSVNQGMSIGVQAAP